MTPDVERAVVSPIGVGDAHPVLVVDMDADHTAHEPNGLYSVTSLPSSSAWPSAWPSARNNEMDKIRFMLRKVAIDPLGQAKRRK